MTELIQRFLIVVKNTIPIVTFTRGEVGRETLMVARIVPLQHRHAKRLFGPEVVIKRPLRYLSGF